LSDLTLANREFAQLPQNRDKLPGFRAIRGRLFFGFFLLAKQKKETRHRRNAFKNSNCAATAKKPPFFNGQKKAPVINQGLVVALEQH
jgi:hypothetical protein